MRGLRTATLTVVLATFAAATGPAGAASRAPLPRLVKVGDPPATLAPGTAFRARFRVVNRSRRTSARSTVTVRLDGGGRRIGLPGKAIVPALKGRRTYRGSRRYVLPGALAPGSYRLVACVKRARLRALCRTAARSFVVPGASQPAPAPAPQPSSTPPPDPPDTTAPSVAIDGPVQGADLGGRQPEVTGSAGTAAGDVREVSVRFTGPSGPQSRTVAVGDDGRWAVRPAVDLAPGSWSVVAEQKDGAGNTGTSNTRGFGINAVLLAAGDISTCGNDNDEATATLLDNLGGDAVAALGDLVYENGTPTEFATCYDETWGRAKPRTHPAIGNHEYQTTNAAGYFGYFGAAAGDPAKGYYSYDLGAWHVVVLNSNCGIVACGAGSPQATWLQSDLDANPRACTVAYWHHPIFTVTTSTTPTDPALQTLWTILDNEGAELVLNGHAHTYERYAQQHADGAAAANGIREIIAGTGGRSHHNLSGSSLNRERENNDAYGVLALTLRQAGYDWKFHPTTPAGFTDSGTTPCG